jgi:hypothetical protein
MKKLFRSIGLATLAAAFVLYFAAEQVSRSGVSCSVPNTFSNGTTADATQVNANFSALVACFANSAAAGANSDITSLTGLTTPLGPSFGGTRVFYAGTVGGSGNAITLTTTSPTSGYTPSAGFIVIFVPGATNAAGPITVNINGTGALNLYRQIRNSGGVTVSPNFAGGELVGPNTTIAYLLVSTGAYVLGNEVYSVGDIKDVGYIGCPLGWQEADGSVLTAATYPDITNAYGTIWGSSAGGVVMPDFRGTFTAGRDKGGSNRITPAGGNFDGSTVGNTQYRQNWTLTLAQLPVFSQTPTLSGTVTPTLSGSVTPTISGTQTPTLSGTVTPTISGTVTPSLSGSHAFTSSAIAAHLPVGSSAWVSANSGGGSAGVPQTAGSLSDLANGTVSTTVDLTNVAYAVSTINGSSFTNSTINGSSFTVSTVNGSNFHNTAINGNSFTVSTIDLSAFGAVSAVTFGSGASHPIIPNAAIVTKCVKL